MDPRPYELWTFRRILNFECVLKIWPFSQKIGCRETFIPIRTLVCLFLALLCEQSLKKMIFQICRREQSVSSNWSILGWPLWRQRVWWVVRCRRSRFQTISCSTLQTKLSGKPELMKDIERQTIRAERKDECLEAVQRSSPRSLAAVNHPTVQLSPRTWDVLFN